VRTSVRSGEPLVSDPCDGDGWPGTPVLAGGLPPRTCRLPERGVTRGCGGVDPVWQAAGWCTEALIRPAS